jgi:hypothetical protein
MEVTPYMEEKLKQKKKIPVWGDKRFLRKALTLSSGKVFGQQILRLRLKDKGVNGKKELTLLTPSSYLHLNSLLN